MIMIMMNLFRGSNLSNMSSIVGTILNQKGCPKHQNDNKPCGSAVPLATGQHGHQQTSSECNMSGLKAPCSSMGTKEHREYLSCTYPLFTSTGMLTLEDNDLISLPLHINRRVYK